MSGQDVARTVPPLPDEDDVVRFLRERPDFFVAHPELVESLVIRHDCGDAVSLVEHQVGVLRQRCGELRGRLDELITNARRNEELGQRLHRLTLALIDCQRIDEIFAAVYAALSEEFHSDFAAIRIFSDPTGEHDAGLAEFVGAGRPGPELFDSMARHGRPVCGRIQRAQVEFLFPDNGTEVGSGALLPIGAPDCLGVLAIASRDGARFRRGMGTVFLCQLAEILTRVLRPYLRRPG